MCISLITLHEKGQGDAMSYLHARQQTRQEDCCVHRVVDQLAHVGDDDGCLALDRSFTMAQAADQQRHHDGQGWGLDSL